MSILFDRAMEGNFEEVINRVGAYPHEAEFRNVNGDTALHFLACYKDTPVDAVIAVYNAYPDALRMKGGDGRTPLGLALHIKASRDTVEFLKRKTKKIQKKHGRERSASQMSSSMTRSLLDSDDNESLATCPSTANNNSNSNSNNNFSDSNNNYYDDGTSSRGGQQNYGHLSIEESMSNASSSIQTEAASFNNISGSCIVEAQLEVAKRENNNLMNKVSDLTAVCKELHRQNNESVNTIEETNAKVAQLEENLMSSMEEKNADTVEKVTELEQRASLEKKTNENLKGEVDRLNNELEGLSNELKERDQAYKREVTKSRQKIENISHENQELEEENEELKLRVSDEKKLHRELVKLKADIDEMTNDNDGLKMKVSKEKEHQRELAKLKAELGDMKLDMAQMVNNNNKLKGDNEELKFKLERSQREHERELEKSQKEHERELKKSQKEHETEMEKSKNEYEAKLEDIDEENEKSKWTLVDMQQNMEQRIEETRKRDKDHASKLKQTVVDLSSSSVIHKKDCQIALSQHKIMKKKLSKLENLEVFRTKHIEAIMKATEALALGQQHDQMFTKEDDVEAKEAYDSGEQECDSSSEFDDMKNIESQLENRNDSESNYFSTPKSVFGHGAKATRSSERSKQREMNEDKTSMRSRKKSSSSSHRSRRNGDLPKYIQRE